MAQPQGHHPPSNVYSSPASLGMGGGGGGGGERGSQTPGMGGGGGGGGGGDRHSLSLKVMRLSKPSFFVGSPILCEPTDLAASALLRPDAITQGEPFGLGDILTLPHSFGFIYLGETFTSYVSINNISGIEVSNVAVKAELQTANARFPLLEIPTTQIPKFKPGDNRDYVIQHQVVEEGIHVLICSTTYTKHDGEKKYFRKFFKFQVENPLDIKTNTYNLRIPSLNSDAVFLEVQLQNTSKLPLFVQSVNFEPTDLFNMTDVNENTADGHQHSSKELRELIYLKPGHSRQSLYKLEPKRNDDPALKTNENIGKLEVIWKSSLGETGRLKRESITRKLPARLEVELALTHIPSRIELEKPFTVTCEITNRSGGLLIPRLFFLKNKMGGVMINGISGHSLGPLQQNVTRSVPITLFPLKPGVQKITGLRVVELQTDKKYDFDNILEVFVERFDDEDFSSSSSSSSAASVSSLSVSLPPSTSPTIVPTTEKV